jgi:two-component system response regulator YesN
LEFLKNTEVDIILTDIKMPIMGGLELSKKSRQLYPEVEIVILSGFSDFKYAKEAISFHAFEYLLKPTNKKNLLETFKSVKIKMDKRQERKEKLSFRGILKNYYFFLTVI